MRLATYRASDGQARACLVIEQEGIDLLLDINAASDGHLPADLITLIGMGDPALDRLKALPTTDARPLMTEELLAPIPRPGKLIAAAGNYQAHVVEGGRPPVDKTKTVPKLFLKPSTSIIGPSEPLELPDVSSAVDWELELAVIIGKGGRHIPVDSALDHVFGYTIVNDVSARRMDWPIAERAEGAWEGFFDWLEGKWIDGFAPLGPWIVTSDEIPDPSDLALRLEVNGEIRQEASTSEMIFDTRELIAFASRLMTLEPGDIIATGTPAGVGDTLGSYLSPGDVMVGSIFGIGHLATPVSETVP
jgi:2-keto-4-pentenoate hydratase/2-oxohepta-3-ene-1,7-dioic acid hydratase in catechol pathway